MVALIILGIIIGIIVLIMLIPVGADVSYEDGNLTVSAKACGVLIKLFPRPPKAEDAPEKPPKEKKPKKKKKPAENKPKKKLKLSFTPDEILSLLRKVMEGFGKFRKMRIDRFMLHYTAAGSDPYNTAITFGYVNAALSALAPLGIERFHVDDCDIYTNLDYSTDKMKVDFGIALSIRIGQIFAVINSILFGALGILIKNRWRLFREKKNKTPSDKSAAAESTEASAITENINNNTENSHEEERND